jgi:hypothetical protein
MNCFNRTAQKPTPSARAAVTGIQEAVRSADSASAREFHRQEENSGANEINITGKRNVRLSAHRGLDQGYFKSQGFSSDRARNEWREFKAGYDAEQQAEAEKAAAPLNASKAQFQETANKLARLERDQVATGVDPHFAEHLTEWEVQNINCVGELTAEALTLRIKQTETSFFILVHRTKRQTGTRKPCWTTLGAITRRMGCQSVFCRAAYSSGHLFG